jgi:hypothetical protein
MGSCRDIYSHLLLESWLWLNDNLDGWLHKRCFRWKYFFNLFDYLWLLYWCLRFRNLYSNWCLFLFYRLNRDLILNYRSRCLDRWLIFSHRRGRNFFLFYRSRNLFLFYRSRNFFLFYRSWRWLLCGKSSNHALVWCFRGSCITLLLL